MRLRVLTLSLLLAGCSLQVAPPVAPPIVEPSAVPAVAASAGATAAPSAVPSAAASLPSTTASTAPNSPSPQPGDEEALEADEDLDGELEGEEDGADEDLEASPEEDGQASPAEPTGPVYLKLLKFKVVDEEGLKVSRVLAKVDPVETPATPWGLLSNQDGEFQLSKVPAGTRIRITLSRDDYETLTHELTSGAPDTEQTLPDFVLKRLPDL